MMLRLLIQSLFYSVLLFTLSVQVAAAAKDEHGPYKCYSIFSETIKFTDVGKSRVIGQDERSRYSAAAGNRFDILVSANQLVILGDRREPNKPMLAPRSGAGFQYHYRNGSLEYSIMYRLIDAKKAAQLESIPPVVLDEVFGHLPLKYILQASTNDFGLSGPFIIAATYKCVGPLRMTR